MRDHLFVPPLGVQPAVRAVLRGRYRCTVAQPRPQQLTGQPDPPRARQVVQGDLGDLGQRGVQLALDLQRTGHIRPSQPQRPRRGGQIRQGLRGTDAETHAPRWGARPRSRRRPLPATGSAARRSARRYSPPSSLTPPVYEDPHRVVGSTRSCPTRAVGARLVAQRGRGAAGTATGQGRLGDRSREPRTAPPQQRRLPVAALVGARRPGAGTQ